MSHNKLCSSFLKLTIVLSVIAVISFATYQSPYLSHSSANALSPNKARHAADAPQPKKVIARMWHGRVLTTKADEYYPYLKEAGIDKIKAIEGNLGAQVMRRNNG